MKTIAIQDTIWNNFWVDQQFLFDVIPDDKFKILTNEELIILARGEHQMRLHYEEENKRLLKMLDCSEQKSLLIEDQLVIIKSKIFGKSSEISNSE